MNYRHHFHAGNFADVMKHALLVRLVRAMQRKAKGLLYLDTHAGRGSYDLTAAAQGDTLARQPEWPAGIGRLWTLTDLPEPLADYVQLVRTFDQRRGNREAGPRFYPGSPALVAELARPQDRLVLCEKQPEEYAALRSEMQLALRASVQAMDGYIAPRAMLPPPEKRALVLIDPPFETQDEYARIVTALHAGLTRSPATVFAIWYPLTDRARVEAFAESLRALQLPPTAVFELAIAGESAALKLRGNGLVVVNPPWQFEAEVMPAMRQLAVTLAQAPGGSAACHWLVPET
ncbi:MAG: 23S rRNA (adenine(2030)-N(6))-methyltransferase RlmJ [Opitutaceae bacterium]|nr:23S rRNA (adenine(2030)-N(6))-methyltransferase RlmJ [Opitutaceae bacterium]MBP9913179.1 23S rRNA (adenine(2030)-N(6))-methyltransferase RlmJ [Opitutaceae bacterium]